MSNTSFMQDIHIDHMHVVIPELTVADARAHSVASALLTAIASRAASVGLFRDALSSSCRVLHTQVDIVSCCER